jgi:hypothetical protein
VECASVGGEAGAARVTHVRIGFSEHGQALLDERIQDGGQVWRYGPALVEIVSVEFHDAAVVYPA